jgi:hypothetical protein
VLQPLGVLGGTIAKKRVNSCEPHIPGRRKIVPLDFESVEEIEDVLWTEIVNIQLRHGASFLGGDETKEQHERVAVAVDGVRTRAAHAREVITQEAA